MHTTQLELQGSGIGLAPDGQGQLFDTEIQPTAPTAELVPEAELGQLVQHYPSADAYGFVRRGYRYDEEAVQSIEANDIESAGGRDSISFLAHLDPTDREVFIQTDTGRRYLIRNDEFVDINASEEQGKVVGRKLGPVEFLVRNLVDESKDWMEKGEEPGKIEVVEVSLGHSDQEEPELGLYQQAGQDPFTRAKDAIENIRTKQDLRITEDLRQRNVLLEDFRTFPKAEKKGLRARAAKLAKRIGSAATSLTTEVQERVKPMRRKAALVAAIGAAAFGAMPSNLSRGESTPSPSRLRNIPEKLVSIMPKPSDNPWTISERVLSKPGLKHDRVSVQRYDREFLKLNAAEGQSLQDLAQHIQPDHIYELPPTTSYEQSDEDATR